MSMMRFHQFLILAAFSGYPLSGTANGLDEVGPDFIAGLAPDRRPANAPVIAEFNTGRVWYRQALKGVSAPYPKSLRFLEDQGAWYTPFDRPNASGPYDIRGLYPVRSEPNP